MRSGLQAHEGSLIALWHRFVVPESLVLQDGVTSVELVVKQVTKAEAPVGTRVVGVEVAPGVRLHDDDE